MKRTVWISGQVDNVPNALNVYGVRVNIRLIIISYSHYNKVEKFCFSCKTYIAVEVFLTRRKITKLKRFRLKA